MTTPRNVPWNRGEWKRLLADSLTDVATLIAALGLDEQRLGNPTQTLAAVRQLPLRVPRGYVERIPVGNHDDPLLLQILPRGIESEPKPGFSTDPIGEGSACGGVLSKYHGRALVIVTGACAIHCRYCFRRHFPYSLVCAPQQARDQALAAIARSPTVEEVILSGGDPLMVDDEGLAELSAKLCSIEHVRRLRIHTRMPIVLPQRVDDGLLAWLAGLRVPCPIVVHANHPREITDEVRVAIAALRRTGITVLNQSVLLAGVNDQVDTLCALSDVLYDAGALPYYLHLLDPVAGAAHFDVPEEAGRRLISKVAARLPGFLVPKLVRERPGAPSKVLIGYEL